MGSKRTLSSYENDLQWRGIWLPHFLKTLHHNGPVRIVAIGPRD